MLHFSLLALLATQALGSPANFIAEYLEPRADSTTPEFISACEAASNCKVTTDSKGNAITEMTSQPSTGKEEGTPPGYPKTYVSFGNYSFAWGCDVHPEVVLGNLGSLCPSSGICVLPESYTTAVGFLKPTPGKTAEPGPQSATLTMTAQGTYPPVLRNAMIQAMQAAALDSKVANYDKGQKWSMLSSKKRSIEDRSIPPPPTHVITGTCDLVSFPNFVAVSTFANSLTMMANMAATVTLPDPVEGFCGAATQGIAGLGSTILSLFPGGAAAGAALGALSGACAVSQDIQ